MSETVESETVWCGRFYNTDGASLEKLAKRVQLPLKEVAEVIREIRWSEAAAWLRDMVRPRLHAIRNRHDAEAALETVPPGISTGDEHIDTIAGEYALAMIERYSAEHEAKMKAIKGRKKSKRAEYRRVKNGDCKIFGYKAIEEWAKDGLVEEAIA